MTKKATLQVLENAERRGSGTAAIEGETADRWNNLFKDEQRQIMGLESLGGVEVKRENLGIV